MFKFSYTTHTTSLKYAYVSKLSIIIVYHHIMAEDILVKVDVMGGVSCSGHTKNWNSRVTVEDDFIPIISGCPH